MTAFEELGVIPQLGDAVSDMGWILPTPIQNEAIPAILGGGDVLIAAETGSGKTGAFCLPVAQILWEKRKDALDPKRSRKQGFSHSWTLNPGDRDSGLAIGSDGFTCESRTPKAWYGCRAWGGLHTEGKYYFEAKITRDGLCRIGWSTAAATLNLGTDRWSFGFGGTGKKSHCRQFDDYGTSFTTNDVLGCFLDLDNFAIWWSKNGVEFNRAYSLSQDFRSPFNALHPAVLVQNSSLQLNFGATEFAHPPGKGFVAVNLASESCISWRDSSSVASVTDTKAPLCIVLEPTRELVEQTHNNLVNMTNKLVDPPIRSISLAAGANMVQLVAELKKGCEVVVGTPRRVVDLAETKALSLKQLQFIVIDEADQFLADKRSGEQLLERMFSMFPLVTPDGLRFQVIVCSATLHNFDIKRFADRHMHFPQWIDLKGMDSVAETVHHVVCLVDAVQDKQWIRLKSKQGHLEDDGVHTGDALRMGTEDKNTISLGTKILKGDYVLKAIDALKMEQCIVFCRTKQQCDQMEAFLQFHGHSAVCLHGDRSPDSRSNALAAFRKGSITFLVCTDVAARGIDVRGIPYVLNVTLPAEKELYVHRIGRVGRAEKMGLSISLVSKYEEKVWYHTCRSVCIQDVLLHLGKKNQSKGVNCSNRQDKSVGGCTIWYNEPQLLSEIEDHLGQTISTVDSDFQIPVDEFDGKIVYGQKRTANSGSIEGHAPQLATSVAQLADLERSLQSSYLMAVGQSFNKIKVL